MSTREPIIDINPIASANGTDRAPSTGCAPSNEGAFRAASFGKRTAREANAAPAAAADVAQATIIGSNAASKKKPSRLGGAVQTAVGGAIMLAGVPMLILPGPGIAAIVGGGAVAAGGLKKLLRKS